MSQSNWLLFDQHSSPWTNRIFQKEYWIITHLYNNHINVRALIGQSAVDYCAGKPTEKSRIF